MTQDEEGRAPATIAAHTPGPWALCDSTYDRGPGDYGPRWDVHIPGRSTIADVREEANARLIALCPEMFEYIESSASNGCATAQGLVAKARGEALASTDRELEA